MRLQHITPSTALLAFWQVRQTWSLLLMTGVSITIAVMLTCAVPLYSRVAETAGLRTVLSPPSETSNLTIHVGLNAMSSNIVNGLDEQMKIFASESFGSYIQSPPQFAMQLQRLSLSSSGKAFANDTLNLSGYSIKDAASHAKIMQGRLPQSSENALEIAVTPETAAILHLHPGSTLTVPFSFFLDTDTPSGNVIKVLTEQNLKLHVVGIYQVDRLDDAFWQGYDGNPLTVGHNGLISSVAYNGLVSNDALLTTLNSIVLQHQEGQLYPSNETAGLYWYYRYDSSHVSIAQLDTIINDVHAWQDTINQNYGPDVMMTLDNPDVSALDISGSTLGSPGHPGTLETYRNQLGVVQLPVRILLYLIVGLILFFVSIMARLLVDRQTDTIALLRSRGASKLQVFSTFIVQGTGLSVIALIVGPLLAMLVVTFFVQVTFSPVDRSALNIIASDVFGTFWRLREYAFIAVLISVATMIVAVYRALNTTILSARRESARSTQRPLWQRLRLDLVVAIIALTSYGVSLYVTNVQEVAQNARISVLIAAPLSLIAPLFLIVGIILLLLRFIPLFLRLSARLAIRGRGAVALLALTQMARQPYTSLRMMLLLTLTLAFTVFALVFNATQSQHVVDTANYEVGADFSGQLGSSHETDTLPMLTTSFRQIRGVTSASPGYVGNVTVASASVENTLAQLRAVDPTTFAQTAIWSQQDNTLPRLLQHLAIPPDKAVLTNSVPVIVDALLWQQLGLSNGAHIQLGKMGETSIIGVVIGEVQHIPTVNDSTALTANSTISLSGGMLVDYASYRAVAQHDNQGSIAPNYIWLRTASDAASLIHVRHALTLQQTVVNPLYDRRALLAQLQDNPLTLDLVGILAIGATSALLLALLGTLVASWSGARTRMTSFAVLRALGTDAGQVANIFLWEQGIVYVTALVLGSIFGWLLSTTVVSVLLFTNLPTSGTSTDITNGDLYALQHALPTSLVVPPSLFLALLVLIAICVVTLSMMMRIVTQPTLGQRLRLNED